MRKSSLLLNIPEIVSLLKNDKLMVVDGGARGELFSPLNKVDKSILKVLRFEPDPDGVPSGDENETIINMAIWKSEEEIDLHVAVQPESSSVLPPDLKMLKLVGDPNINLRRTKKVIKVPGISIDEVCVKNKLPAPDLIKLDIHGVEYEALIGAKKGLASDTFCVLVESWLFPIHKGQKTRGAIEELLNGLNFFLFEQLNIGNWIRTADDVNAKKTQVIVCDSLYFKDVIYEDLKLDSTEKAIKKIGLADLFGQYGLAAQLNKYFYEENVIEQKLYKLIKEHLLSVAKRESIVKIYQNLILKVSRKLHRFS